MATEVAQLREAGSGEVLVVFVGRIDDPAAFAEYQQLGRLSLEGRRFERLAGPDPEAVIEGGPIDEVVVFRFPSRAAAEDWLQSDLYQRALTVRREASTVECVIVGLDPSAARPLGIAALAATCFGSGVSIPWLESL